MEILRRTYAPPRFSACRSQKGGRLREQTHAGRNLRYNTIGLRIPPQGVFLTHCPDSQAYYLSSTSAPASSRAALRASASSLAAPSLITLGAPSTRSLASLRPRPATSFTFLTTWSLLAPALLSTTSKEVFSSTAAAPAPGAAATATAAAAGSMPYSSLRI